MESSRIKALFIDDDYISGQLITPLLKDECDVDYAPDGFTAQKMLMSKQYDIILCDIFMPFMTGLVLIEELRRKQISTPFIFVSGNIDDTVTRQAFQLGASNIIQKPFKVSDVKEKIRLAIEVQKRSQIPEKSEQERGYIYSKLKYFYYDYEKIIYNLQYYNVPLKTISEELERKEMTGKCKLDDPDYIKMLTMAA